MNRRPYALLPRLARIERELAAAAALLPALIEDATERRAQAEDNEVRILITASLTAAALLLHQADPRVLQAFVDAIGPEGDIEVAEEFAAVLIEQAWASMADGTGEGH